MDNCLLLGNVTNTTSRGSGHGIKRTTEESGNIIGDATNDAIDESEHKRQKARERYANMPNDQKAERNARRREDYHRRKAGKQATNMTQQESGVPSVTGCVNPTPVAEYSLRIGNGSEETFCDDYVQLADGILIKTPPDNKSIDMLIDRVFPNLNDNCASSSYMCERTILSMTHEHVDEVNALMIGRFIGEEKVYYSFDSVDGDKWNDYPLDLLNSITPNGLPPHELKVKKNCPIILLVDLDPHNGLCNGTRLVVRGCQNHVIVAEVINGQHAGERVFIPRIPMSTSESLTSPLKFKRKQFPIQLSFAMTINKAQSQTIPIVGIYLPYSVFSNGQLYVPLLRGISCEKMWVLAKTNKSTWLLAKTNKTIDPTRKRE